jgi:hypothetical protein
MAAKNRRELENSVVQAGSFDSTHTVLEQATDSKESFVKRSLNPAVLFLVFGIICGSTGPARAQATNLTGEWTGMTRVLPPCFFSTGRCDAVNKITFSLTQKGNRLKGKYTCAYGNKICRDGGMDTKGKIVSGKIASNQVRISVLIPNDLSNCYYNGMIMSSNSIRGGYSCYQGGGLLEEGNWDIQRAGDD